MKREDAEEFTQSLGQIGEGWWRQAALGIRLGIPKLLGYAGPDGPRRWMRERVSAHTRIASEEQERAILELTKEDMSQREIGAALGISDTTVQRAQSASNGALETQEAATDEPKNTMAASNEAERAYPHWSEEDERQRVTTQKIEAAKRAAQTLLLSFSSNVETIQQGIELGASIKFEPDHVALYKQAVSGLNIILKKRS